MLCKHRQSLNAYDPITSINDGIFGFTTFRTDARRTSKFSLSDDDFPKRNFRSYDMKHGFPFSTTILFNFEFFEMKPSPSSTVFDGINECKIANAFKF